jgi:hypothetical protein
VVPGFGSAPYRLLRYIDVVLPICFEIDNITFIGAASASYGIYFANWVLQPKVTNNRFLNFGGNGMYAVTFQGNNWSIDLNDNRYLVTDAATFERHFCQVLGVANTGTAGNVSAGQVVNGNRDGGNSRLNAAYRPKLQG